MEGEGDDEEADGQEVGDMEDMEDMEEMEVDDGPINMASRSPSLFVSLD